MEMAANWTVCEEAAAIAKNPAEADPHFEDLRRSGAEITDSARMPMISERSLGIIADFAIAFELTA
jgi:hypothetical protein